MENTMEAEDKGVPIFVTTNVDTNLVISSSPSDTVAILKGKIRNGHLICFPHFGDIEIGALMVEHKSLYYHLPDSIFVETVFHGSNGMRYILAEVSGLDLCNQRENTILSGKDGNIEIATKTENGEFHRHLDKISNGTSLTVHNVKSKKKKKHKLVTEGLHVKEGHNNNNKGYTGLVAADGQAVVHEESGKDVTNPGSGDKITDPKGGNKRKKREKEHDHNKDLAKCSLSPCKKKMKRELVAAEIENNGHCSSEWMVKNNEMGKNSPLVQVTVSEKVNTVDSLNDNGTPNVLTVVENCEQQNLPGNTHTNAGKDHISGNDLGTTRKHETSKAVSTERKCETSSKIINEHNSLNGTEEKTNGLQRRADDSTEFNTGKKIKSKRKRSLKTALEDGQGILCNGVNDPRQTTEHGNLQECDILTKSKHEIKMGSQHGLSNDGHSLSSKCVDDEHQITNHHHFLEYKFCKPEEVAKCPSASNVSDKNGLISNANIETVKYLDVSNSIENHQPCTITKKTKHSRHDMTQVDFQERIITGKIPKNNLNVNSSKDERDVSIADAGNKSRRDIPYENGSVGYLNAHPSKNSACRDYEHNTEGIQIPSVIPSVMDKECHNAEEVKSSEKIPTKINRDRTTKAVKRGMCEVVAEGSQSEPNAGHLEHLPETLGTTPSQKCNDKEIKSSKNSSSKLCREKPFNIEKRGIEEEELKSPGATVVSDKNGQTNNDTIGSVKYLDVSNNIENQQPSNVTRKRKKKLSKNDITLVDAQEKIITEKVKNDDMIVNSSRGKRDVSILDVGNEDRRDTPNQDRTTKPVERGMFEVVAEGSQSEQNAGDLEHLPETLGTTPGEKCNEKEIKSSKTSSSKVCKEKPFNIEKRGIEEEVLKSPGAAIVSDKKGQRNNDTIGSFKYLDVSNNMEDHQTCNITRKRKTKHSKNDITLVDAQEKNITEKVKNDDTIVNSSRRERDVSILDVGNEDTKDSPGEIGRVKYPNASHSKNNAARDFEHFTETIGTTSMASIEDCNTEKVKSSKDIPSKISQDIATKVVERGMDNVAAKGRNSKQNARSKEKKQKDGGLKSNSSVVPECSNSNRLLKDRHTSNAVVKNHLSVEQNIVQRRKGSADVDCKVEKTIPQFDTNNTNHPLRPVKDTGIRGFKYQSTPEGSRQKLAQKGKLDTKDLSYVNKSPKVNQGDAHFTEKIPPKNKDVASPKNIAESGHHNLKKRESYPTTSTTQSPENNEDINWVTSNDRSQGADGCYDRKDNTVSRSCEKIANDAYVDSQRAGEERRIVCNPVKLQLVGRTNDGKVMNKARDMNVTNPEIKTAKKTKVDNHSKKSHISLFRNSSDVSTEGDDGIDSGSSSLKGSASDSPHSYDSDAGSRDNILKVQSKISKTDREPSTNGARLTTADGKNEDCGGNGSIHSKFLHILAKKTGLGELFKIARSHQKPESQHFGGDFMADDSPTVDMVLETQESQMCPVLNAPHN